MFRLQISSEFAQTRQDGHAVQDPSVDALWIIAARAFGIQDRARMRKCGLRHKFFGGVFYLTARVACPARSRIVTPAGNRRHLSIAGASVPYVN